MDGFHNSDFYTEGSINAATALTGDTASITTSLTAAGLTYPVADGGAGQCITTNGAGTLSIGVLGVAGGGSGAATLLDHGVLVGSGTGAISPLAVGTNGQLLIGSTGADPVFATLTDGTGLTATTGAGTLTLDCDTASDTTIGVATFDENDFTVTLGDVTYAPRTRFRSPVLYGGFVENIGCSYNVGTGLFSICGADGTALSATNPGYVTLKNSSSIFVTVKITANQDFIDANGASEIIGNLFGLTTGVAHASEVPFFIGAVLKDTDDAIAFGITRLPIPITPAAAYIGAPDDPVADTNWSFFSFENIDETKYESRPFGVIGCINMKKSIADDWTVSALSSFSGIGWFGNDAYTMDPGHYGAAAGKITADNGGTAITAANILCYYAIQPMPYLRVWIREYSISGALAGAGAVNMRGIFPFKFGAKAEFIGFGANAGVQRTLRFVGFSNQHYFEAIDILASGWIQNNAANWTDIYVAPFEFSPRNS